MPAFYVDSWWGTTATTSIFIAAAITDWLDGYLARKVDYFSVFPIVEGQLMFEVQRCREYETCIINFADCLSCFYWLFSDEIRIRIWGVFRPGS